MSVKVVKKRQKTLTFRRNFELRAFQVPKDILVSDWANENRHLDPITSAEPGQWMTERTPYLRGIMDAFIDPALEEITIMASTQVGKTEAMLNMLAYAIDQDPAPSLWVMSREEDAKSISKDRIQRMIHHSPALKSHKTSNPDDITMMEIALDRMIVYMAGANSPAALAQRPIRYLFLDELDKYPRFSGRESDPVKLATERTRTFWNRKIIKCSTPTTRDGYIFREYERTDRCRYYVPCPACGEYQVLIFSQVRWPEEERDPEKIKDGRLAWYECLHCKHHMNDTEKQRMMHRGKWAQEGCSVDKDGKVFGEPHITSRRGFWINALYSPWVTISEVAVEFLNCRDQVELLMNFVNSWLAEVWEEKTEETEAHRILKLAGDYQEGEVPQRVLVLTAGVDVQKDHFIVVIRGWGIGEESWLIRKSRLESWEAVESVLFLTQYQKQDKKLLPVRLSCIDSGFRTAEVYEFCRKWRDRSKAIKDEETLSGVPYKVTKIDRNPRTGSVIEGGISLWKLDTSYYKDKIARMISAEEQDLSQWHIFSGMDEHNDYIKQFCSEHKVIVRDKKTGRTREIWKKKLNSIPNHYWDAEVYAVSAADMIHVSAMREEGESTVYQHRRRFVGGNWLGERREWFQKR